MIDNKFWCGLVKNHFADIIRLRAPWDLDLDSVLATGFAYNILEFCMMYEKVFFFVYLYESGFSA